MNKAEFDKFADEYRNLHIANIKASGESPEFFAEYKVKDTANLASKLDLIGPLNVLDYGCGVGNSITSFKKHLPNCQLTGADISKKSLDIAEARFPGETRFVTLTGVSLPFDDESFDIIFSACVFHHIPHEEHGLILQDIWRTLKSNGLLIIFEHNPYNPLTVKAVNTCPFDENAVLITPSQLVSSLIKAKFVSARVSYRIFFPGQLRTMRFLEPLLTWLPLGAQYYVAARKV